MTKYSAITIGEMCINNGSNIKDEIPFLNKINGRQVLRMSIILLYFLTFLVPTAPLILFR